MPSRLPWFTGNQPITPVFETLRGLLMSPAIGDSAVTVIARFGAFDAGGYPLVRPAVPAETRR